MKNFLLIIVSFTLITGTYGQGISEKYIATDSCRERFFNRSFFVFPEARENPIRWNDSLKEGWLSTNYSKNNFLMNARPGEYFVYQAGAWAVRNDLKDVRVIFSDLKNKEGKIISTNRMTCFPAGGINSLGKSFHK